MSSKLFFKTLLLACTSVTIFSFGQITISGKVMFRNQPLKDISVTLKGSYDGATTDVNGNYSFVTEEKGIQTLVFSNSSYEDVEKNVNIESSNIVIDAVLKEYLNEINAVVITAGSFEASDKRRATALLKPLDIYTTAGADAQITQALGYWPGVQKVGESEGLFVRGGTSGETKIYIDGSLVNNFFTQSTPGLSGRDRFNTSLFKGNIFSSGGYSAVYGQALSSVLVLESVDLPQTTSYDFSVTPLSLGANYQKLNDNKTASWGISASYTNLSLVSKLNNFNTNFSKVPEGFRADANFRIKTKRGGFIKYFTNFQTNEVGVYNPSIELNYDKLKYDLKSNFTFHTLSYKEKFGKYKIDISTSYTFNQNNMGFNTIVNDQTTQEFAMNNKGSYFNAKAVIEKKLWRMSTLKAGLELNNSIEDRQYGIFKKHYIDFLSATFLESNLAFNRYFSLSFGARAEKSSYLNQYNFSPRLSAAYKFSDNWVTSFAYGKFYQNPDSKLINSSARLTFEKADHYILQLQHNSDGRSLRLEAFYKDYNNLIKTVGDMSFQVAKDNSGNGYAKGFEMFWRDNKTFKSLDYWITYSYLDSQRNFLYFPSSLPPTFAAKHTISAVAKRFVLEWKTGFNLSYTYASGRPYYDIVSNQNNSIVRQNGYLRDYSALNFSVNYVPSIGKKNGNSTVYVLSINNILGSKNIYGYTFSHDGMRRNPVLPAYNRFIFIGAFISFGQDKTNEAINNNL